MADTLTLSVAQITSTDQMADNLAQVESLYLKSPSADLVVFPENTLFFRIKSGDPIQGLSLDGPEAERLQSLVEKQSTALMLTTALQEPGGKVSNATVLFLSGAKPEVVYKKIHLFDVDVPGAPPVRESEYFKPGSELRILDFRGWKIGLSICYDLRFAELYSKYADKVDVIMIPSAFLQPTGQAHWHVLLRARAIENQCYVVAPAQSGEHISGGQMRKTFGHALVVGPWGEIVSESTASPAVSLVQLSKEPLLRVRSQIPMASHRRL